MTAVCVRKKVGLSTTGKTPVKLPFNKQASNCQNDHQDFGVLMDYKTINCDMKAYLVETELCPANRSFSDSISSSSLHQW